MKLTHIAAAVAATMASGIAAAASPYNTLPVSPTVEMYFSGSTASDPLFKVYMAKNCDSGTLDAYRADVSTGSTQYLYVCKSAGGFGASSTATNPGATGYIVVHKSGTSSQDGVTPIASQTKIKFLTQTDVVNNASLFVDTPVAASGAIGAYNSLLAPVASIIPATTAQPDVGVSDVEPKFFPATGVNLSNITAVKDYQLIFGVMATKVARNALQSLQGKTVGSDTLENMPSLARADATSIFTSTVRDMNAFGYGSSLPIAIGRRSGGSGTTKTFDLTFANAACDTTATALTSPSSTAGSSACTSSPASPSPQTVVQMGTSEDMEVCLNNFQTNGIAAFGEISTDYQPAVSDGWRFVRIEGFAPANINTAEGRYPVWAEGTLNTYSSAPPSGFKGVILASVITETKTPATLSALNAGLTQPIEGYAAGFLTLASNASYPGADFPLQEATVQATPIALVTHGADSCSTSHANIGLDPVDPTNTFGFVPE